MQHKYASFDGDLLVLVIILLWHVGQNMWTGFGPKARNNTQIIILLLLLK